MISRKCMNRKKSSETYYEAHHIKPRCFGGEGDSRNSKHCRMVKLADTPSCLDGSCNKLSQICDKIGGSTPSPTAIRLLCQ